MKAVLITLLLSFTVLASGQSLEDGWKGILPLRSTKKDVEKTYGPPSRIDDNDYYQYVGDNFSAQVNYSTEPCSGNQYDRGKYNVPKDTVLDIWVYVRGNVLLSTVEFDRSKFVRKPDQELLNLVHYYSSDNAMSISSSISDKEGNEYFGRVIYRTPPQLASKFTCPKE